MTKPRCKDPNLLPSPEKLAEIELIKQQIQEEHRFRREKDLENQSATHFSAFAPRIFRFSPMRGTQGE